MPLLEEVITIPALKHSHEPVKNVRALQFPKLFKVGDERWPFSKNRIFFNKPTAFNYTRNCVLSLFLFGPFYRLYYWISVPTVTVNIVKRFSTQKYTNSQAEAGIFPFINNVQDFVIKQAPTGHGSDSSSLRNTSSVPP